MAMQRHVQGYLRPVGRQRPDARQRPRPRARRVVGLLGEGGAVPPGLRLRALRGLEVLRGAPLPRELGAGGARLRRGGGRGLLRWHLGDGAGAAPPRGRPPVPRGSRRARAPLLPAAGPGGGGRERAVLRAEGEALRRLRGALQTGDLVQRRHVPGRRGHGPLTRRRARPRRARACRVGAALPVRRDVAGGHTRLPDRGRARVQIRGDPAHSTPDCCGGVVPPPPSTRANSG
mmetsp:Transcript_122478/g.347265  ORF Transcript_122478/g.347265 Transcript_122478/m.347265 type:complete len:232 (-) Transcript_122478:2-697(-)